MTTNSDEFFFELTECVIENKVEAWCRKCKCLRDNRKKTLPITGGKAFAYMCLVCRDVEFLDDSKYVLYMEHWAHYKHDTRY